MLLLPPKVYAYEVGVGVLVTGEYIDLLEVGWELGWPPYPDDEELPCTEEDGGT